MRTIDIIFKVLYLWVCCGLAYAFDDKSILQRFEAIKEPECQKPKLQEPKEPDTPFFYERHYLTIDGGRECQILDAWVEPLTKLPNEFRRDFHSVLYRKQGKVWVKEYGLDYIPSLRLRDRETGRIYLHVRLHEPPFFRNDIVYFRGAWEERGKDKIFVKNIFYIGDCPDKDVGSCIQEREMVERALALLEKK